MDQQGVDALDPYKEIIPKFFVANNLTELSKFWFDIYCQLKYEGDNINSPEWILALAAAYEEKPEDYYEYIENWWTPWLEYMRAHAKLSHGKHPIFTYISYRQKNYRAWL